MKNSFSLEDVLKDILRVGEAFNRIGGSWSYEMEDPFSVTNQMRRGFPDADAYAKAIGYEGADAGEDAKMFLDKRGPNPIVTKYDKAPMIQEALREKPSSYSFRNTPLGRNYLYF